MGLRVALPHSHTIGYGISVLPVRTALDRLAPAQPCVLNEATKVSLTALMNKGEQTTLNRTDRGWQGGFWSLIATQFQTAFNDNAVKFLVIYIIVAMNFPNQFRDRLILVVGALFALPFIFFSMTGGYFADRYSKRSVTIGTKILELGVMVFTIAGLYLQNLPMECTSVFLISMEAALFGPSKYGLLPELLPENRLSWGNGIIELGTFVASISATMAAGILAERYRGREAVAGFLLFGFTCLGLLTSFGISRVPAADPRKRFRWNVLGELASQMKTIYADGVLFWSVIGNTYLWFLAALLQFTIVVYGHDVLHIDDTRTSYLQAAVGIGIGLGSLAAGYLSRGKIEMGLIPIGALGMTVFGALLYFSRPTAVLAGWLSAAAFHQGSSMAAKFGTWIVAAVRLRIPDLSLLGFFGGFFAVPLNAMIQHRPRPEQKGGVIAVANLLSFIGVFLAAGAYYLFSDGFHQTPAGVFLDGAILTLVTTTVSIYLLRHSLLSFVRKST
jgi:acyl-[acyl-carrier-protein]-phospholipid O-acyltransferase / long-chain-fatty-acid--[acyl-carrier-protein] ligase